mgnify:CR=1 FL=1
MDLFIVMGIIAAAVIFAIAVDLVIDIFRKDN